MNKKLLPKKLKKMEKVSPYISREEELSKTVRSFQVLYDKFHKGFKEKDAVKNTLGWSHNSVGIYSNR